jgi:hypothetical protein
MMWASRITNVALGFSVPPLLGFGLDRWWGTVPVVTMIGAVAGFALGMFQTIRLASDLPSGRGKAKTRHGQSREKVD